MAYELTKYNARLWVTYQGRLIGGYNTNDLRSYVFPLYTPQGMLVIQEAPPDHPHHQGIWTGLEIDGNDVWNAGSRNLPRHRQEMQGALNEIAVDVTDSGVQFTHGVRWVTTEGEELLQEQRTVSLRATDQVTLVDWQSIFSHPAKASHIGQTKESGIGVRVTPHWETRFGGQIRNAQGATGEQGCFDQLSPWLNVEGKTVGDGVAGLVLIPTSEQCPWFTRDYGIHLYNPARHHAIALAAGEQVVWSMRVLAYDGAHSLEQINDLVVSI